MPNLPSTFRAVSVCWSEFADSIVRGGRVLDLGTGVGYVLEEIGRMRPDLELVGVDSVPALAVQQSKLRILSGVRMEKLPFAAAEFDCVCSQFGFEYSDMCDTACEIARVLRPGGKVQLLVHHSGGVVTAQSSRRRAALQWIAEQSGIFEWVARLTKDYRALLGAASAAFGRAARLAGELHLDAVAPEVAFAMHQVIAAGERTWAEQVERGLARLTTQAWNELTILGALERVALDAESVEKVVCILREAGLETMPAGVLEAEPAMPFAWLLQASKAAA